MKLIEVIYSDELDAKTFLENKCKTIKYTNRVGFNKTIASKAQKIIVETYIDKHHHQIVIKINGKEVYRGFAE